MSIALMTKLPGRPAGSSSAGVQLMFDANGARASSVRQSLLGATQQAVNLVGIDHDGREVTAELTDRGRATAIVRARIGER